MIEVRDLKNYKEFQEWVDYAIDKYRDDVFKPNKSLSYNRLYTMIQNGAFFKILEYDKKIIAYGMAVITTPAFHSKTKALSMLYYHSKIDGIIAVKALKLFHREMIQYARDNKIPICMTNSILENYETFNRILISDGWERRGCSLVYRV